MPLRAWKISSIVSLLLFLLRFYFFFFLLCKQHCLTFSFFFIYFLFKFSGMVHNFSSFSSFFINNANNNYTFMSTQEFRYFIVMKLGLLNGFAKFFPVRWFSFTCLVYSYNGSKDILFILYGFCVSKNFLSPKYKMTRAVFWEEYWI